MHGNQDHNSTKLSPMSRACLLLLSTTPDSKWEPTYDPLQQMGLYIADSLLHSPEKTYSPLPSPLSGHLCGIQEARDHLTYFAKSLAFTMGLYNSICDSGASIPVPQREEIWARYLKILTSLQGAWEWPDGSTNPDKDILSELQRLISLDDDIGRLSINAHSLFNNQTYMACQATATVYLTKILTHCFPEVQSTQDNHTKIVEKICPHPTGRLAINDLLPILITGAKCLVKILEDFVRANQGAFDAAIRVLSAQGTA